METVLEQGPLRSHWESVKAFINLQGVNLMLQAIAMATKWKNYSAR